MDFRLEQWMKKMLPKDKQTFSRDAVEILLNLLWEEAKKAEQADEKQRKWDDMHPDI